MNKVLLVAAIIQAASAVAIALLTRQLSETTKRYADATDGILEENRNLIRATEQATIFYDALPILDLPKMPEVGLFPLPNRQGVPRGIVGSWKNIGRGPALEFEMAVEIDHVTRMPSDFGQADIDTEWRVGIAPGDELSFRIPVGRSRAQQWERSGFFDVRLFARYRDLHGNFFLSIHTLGDRAPTSVSLIQKDERPGDWGEEWREGVPIGDIEYNPMTDRLEPKWVRQRREKEKREQG
jgi:hypothetical protein